MDDLIQELLVLLCRYDGTFPSYVAIFDKAAQTRIAKNPTGISADASSNTFTGAVAYCRCVGAVRLLDLAT